MGNKIKDIVERIISAEPEPIPEEFSDNDRLIGKGYEIARDYLVGSSDNSLVPTWTMVTENGQTAVFFTPFDGEDSKELTAKAMRKILRETKAVRYSFVSEAWLATTTEEEWETDKRPPSKRDERIEVVLIVAADKAGASAKAYEIVREWDTGKVTGLKPMSEGPMTNFEGRFSDLLA